ncbi:MAG TPA: OmpH family outer membrane protein [Allosphingosinicella sp.]|jgi:Skp family chaperone for outer membrane proteins
MKKIILGTAVAALSMSLPGVAVAQRAPGAVIVVVDTDRIYRDCNACRVAQTQLQTQATALQQRAQTLGTPIQTEMQSIQQAATAARAQAGAARTTAEAALQQRLQRLQQQETTANQEIQRGEQTLRSTQAHVLQQINVRLNPIINTVMTQRNANVALDVNATLARAQGLDVTDAVLALLNQQLPSVSVTPLPQAQQPAAPQPTGR